MFNFLKPKVVLIMGSNWQRVGQVRTRTAPSKGELFYFKDNNTYYDILNVIHWGDTRYLIVNPIPEEMVDTEIFGKYKKS